MKKRVKHRPGRYAVIVTAALALVPLAAQTAVVGEVVALTGRAVAATQRGAIRSLAVGGSVNGGETVVTSHNSLVRLKFIDDAYVILRPNTRFVIEDYNVGERAEDNRSLFSLLKGGVRTITGLIGRRNRNGYRMRTSVSTIGIRGTEFQFMHCQRGDCGIGVPDGDYLNVSAGQVAMTTAGGEEIFDGGQFAYVSGPNAIPLSIPAAAAGSLVTDPTPPAQCE